MVAGGQNDSFRVDRRVIRRSQSKAIVYGHTCEDDKTLTPASRARSHYKICPWVRRPEMGGSDVEWLDEMVAINGL